MVRERININNGSSDVEEDRKRRIKSIRTEIYDYLDRNTIPILNHKKYPKKVKRTENKS